LGIGVDLCGAPGTSFTHERKDELMAPMIDLDVFLPVFNGQQTENFVSVYSMRLRVVLLRLPGPLYTLAVYDQAGGGTSLMTEVG
jgi:ABC-type protease/lipase transport system fused ATPase/permease subunit